MNLDTINTPWSSIGYLTFKRTYSRPLDESGTKTEEFKDVVDRVIKACATQLNCGFTPEEEEKLRSYMLGLKGIVAGRFLWQLGSKTVDRLGLASLQNCAAVVVDEPVRPFTWTMDMLMLGAGVGYNIQRKHVDKIPPVKDNFKTPTRVNDAGADFIVPDSREGWVGLLGKVLKSAFLAHESGKQTFTYSTQLVRGKGVPIKGFGGVTSGPEELVWGINEIGKILEKRAGRKVRPIDVLDIMNIIGYIVVSGNIRRSAQICIGDPDDVEFLLAKRWDLGNIPSWRAMSNNSVACDNIKDLHDFFWDGYKGKGEPYGLINLKLSRKVGRLGETEYTDPNVEIFNPCQPAWATVLTPIGIATIGDLKVGDTIWSGTSWTKVTAKWSTGVKSVYEYNTHAGRFIGTENHRIVSEGEKVEVKNATSIDSNTYTISDIGDTFFDSQAVMDGLVIGDGSVHKASNNLVHLFIGEKDGDYLRSSIAHLIKKHRPGIKDTAYEIETSVKHYELPATFDRKIPARFKFGTPVTVRSFLRGLYSANGSVTGGRVTLKATSLDVIKDAQEMLSSIGIRSYYTINHPKDVIFNNGVYTSKKSYDLNISKQFAEFANLVGFIQEYKTEKLQSILDKRFESGRKYDYAKITYDITDVNYIGDEEVFDITVEDSKHTYWTGGVLVSNCSEVTLNNYENCCLAEMFLPNISSKKELIEISQLLYRVCKHSLTLPCHNKETESVVHKNMRIGIGVTGYLESSDEQKSWLSDCYASLREFDKKYSKEHNLPESIKLTVIKPSGTLSLLPGVTPGVHPAYAKYMIRRIRIASNHALVKVCRDHGYKVEYVRNFDGSNDHTTVVVEFPFRHKENAVLAKDVSAIKQLEYVKELQSVWADNAVSCTVYYKPEELGDIQEYLKKNYKNTIKSVSFLLHSEHGFDQAPLEEITEEQYNALVASTKPITSVDEANIGLGEECAGGACPVR